MKWLEIVARLIAFMGPELKKALYDAVVEWEKHTDKTKLPFDDIACMILKMLLS